MDVSTRLAQLKQEFLKESSEKAALEKLKGQQEREARELKGAGIEKVLMKTLLEKASEKAREDGKKVLSETSTNAIQMVMDDDYVVDMESSIKRGVPHTDLVVRQTTDTGLTIETDPANDEGGGTADIVSISTFMSLGMLAGEDNQAPYFLDEPTKYVSPDNSENVAKFLKEIVSYSGKQTFLVTHDPVVAEAGDRVFYVEKDKNTRTSHVTDITNN